MKYTYIALIAVLFCSCNRKGKIEFTGSTPGVKEGVFTVKTLTDSTIYGANIKNEKFALEPKQLSEPGYYKLDVSTSDTTDKHDPFEVYLEPGKYTIETEAGKLYQYPKITSPSKIQEQLSAFYTLSDKMSLATEQEAMELHKQIKTQSARLSTEAFNNLLYKVSETEKKMHDNNVNAFKAFLKQYPQSEISTHLMSKLNYEDDPVSYYAIYQTLTPAAKNTDEGKEIGDKLSHLIKLVAGIKAPAIQGKTPDGKPFDPKTINKKLIVIDFWRAGNDFSRQNHQQLIQLLAEGDNKDKIAIVSVSLDSKPDWWTTAIKDDHLSWTQVSDLKGDDSPNAVNWSITKIPTYYLLDNNWTIIQPNIEIASVGLEISDYLKKHR
ncbi:thioredoxin-like domain-containing protein [Mucilaginibacter sp.]|uniref:TlpA family protein disulfide reductase n=1 Tax=Mucilaginibacter sp. TaxID=1882438 RepID=UPI003D121ABE